jgi:hypothetical protein
VNVEPYCHSAPLHDRYNKASPEKHETRTGSTVAENITYSKVIYSWDMVHRVLGQRAMMGRGCRLTYGSGDKIRFQARLGDY